MKTIDKVGGGVKMTNLVPAKDLWVDPDYFRDKMCMVLSADIAIIDMLNESGISYHIHMNTPITDDMIASIDFVLLTGGTDISPAIYHQERGDHTDTPDTDRDFLEVSLIKKCLVLGVPVIGICRGAQLLSSVLGGRLIQHDTDGYHMGSHDLHLSNGFTLENCYANHHQLIIPPSDSKVIAKHKDVNEIIYHPGAGLSVQYHPEWHMSHDRQFKYFFRLIHDLLEGVL